MIQFRKMATRFLEFVDVEWLEEDELYYELAIRRAEGALRKNFSEQRKVLASHFNAEKAEPFLFPTTTGLGSMEEIQTCENKITNLILFCENEVNHRTRQFKTRVATKIIHLEHRLQRISQKDESFVQVVNQLFSRISRIRDQFVTPNQENPVSSQNRPPRQSTPLNGARSTNPRENLSGVEGIEKEIELLKSRLNSLSFERDLLKQQQAGLRPEIPQPSVIFHQPPAQPPPMPLGGVPQPVQQQMLVDQWRQRQWQQQLQNQQQQQQQQRREQQRQPMQPGQIWLDIGEQRRLEELRRAEAVQRLEQQRQQECARQTEERRHREIAQQIEEQRRWEAARHEEEQRRQISTFFKSATYIPKPAILPSSTFEPPRATFLTTTTTAAIVVLSHKVRTDFKVGCDF
jgi:hypothetical protein